MYVYTGMRQVYVKKIYIHFRKQKENFGVYIDTSFTYFTVESQQEI